MLSETCINTAFQGVFVEQTAPLSRWNQPFVDVALVFHVDDWVTGLPAAHQPIRLLSQRLLRLSFSLFHTHLHTRSPFCFCKDRPLAGPLLSFFFVVFLVLYSPLCPLFLQVTSSTVSNSDPMVMGWLLPRPAPLLCSSLRPSRK